MPIQYGDLTVIIKPSSYSLLNSWFTWLTPDDEKSDEKTKCIFLFDDGEICDAEEKQKDVHFDISFSGISSDIPYMFRKGKRCYFHTILNSNYTLSSFEPLLGSYSKYKVNNYLISDYNCVYYMFHGSVKKDIFCMIRTMSTETMPCYQFAYDTDEFSKSEVIHMILHILTSILQR